MNRMTNSRYELATEPEGKFTAAKNRNTHQRGLKPLVGKTAKQKLFGEFCRDQMYKLRPKEAPIYQERLMASVWIEWFNAHHQQD